MRRPLVPEGPGLGRDVELGSDLGQLAAQGDDGIRHLAHELVELGDVLLDKGELDLEVLDPAFHDVLLGRGGAASAEAGSPPVVVPSSVAGGRDAG